MKNIRLIILVTLLTLLAAGQTSVWAANTWTVEYDDGKFKITRSGDLSITETVQYRTVSLSAFAGQHFTAKTGTETFGPNQDVKEISVSEGTPGTAAYLYQNGTSRKYRFEVLDQGGFQLASCDRSITTGTNVPISGLFNDKEITIYSSEVKYSDAGYNQTANTNHYISSSSYYSLGGIAPAAYYTLIGAQLRSTLSFEAKEVDNGYQYVQILINNINDCDNRSNPKCDDGDPGHINISRYMAGFDHQPGSANTTYAAYSFPVTSQPDDNQNPVDNAWDNGVTNKLYKQKFNTNCRASDGRLILPVDFEKLVVRFNASGGGGDDWYAKNVKAHIQAVDGTAPTLISTTSITVSSGPYNRGSEFYISVPFGEIVTLSGSTRKLTTSWGDATYLEGSGSNVLTFKGTINVNANETLSITGREGTIADLAGNTFSGSLNKTFHGITSADPTYSITYDLADGSVASANPDSYTYETATITLNNPTRLGYYFDGWTGSNGNTPSTTVTIANHSHENKTYTAHWTRVWTGSGAQGDPYVISSPQGLDLLAQYVNGLNGNTPHDCNEVCFLLGKNITYTHTTAWNLASSTENNYTAIGTNDHPFQGTFDGQGYTVSGIRLYWGSENDADRNQGLFGAIGRGGTVRGVNLADARITGRYGVGGIAGNIFDATVEDCSVAADVCIHAVQGSSKYHGGIVGWSQGSVRYCLSRATLTVANVAGCEEYGAITGNNTASKHSVKDCIAVGATVPNVNNAGAITGNNNGNNSSYVQRNYYRACTVAGTANATGVGVGSDDGNSSPHDLTTNQGAQALYSLTLPEGVTLVRTASATLPGTDNRTYTTGADIDGAPYAYEGASLSFSYTGATADEGYIPAIFVNGVQATDNGNGTFSATMPAEDATVTVSTVAKDFTADGHSGDSEADAYIIYNKDQLDLLATRVNSGTGDDYANSCYSGKFIKLGADIEYDGTENNYTPIGSFFGTFDGDGHTISGININRNIDNQGLFGSVTGGTVQNVTLANSTITGGTNVGGIVGHILYGTIQNCRVESTVTIGADADDVWRHGGIVGDNGGTIIGCASAATISHNNHNSCAFFGAIAGSNSSTIQNCLALGATVTLSSSNGGAIVGNNSGTLANNYYYNCTVAKTANAVNVGVGSSSGAPADQAGARSVHALTLLAGATASGESVDIDATTYYAAGTTVTLSLGSAPAGYQEPFLGYSLNGTPFEGNSFEMPAADAIVTARWTVADFETGHAGTEADPYIIYNKDQLDQLATRVNGGTGYSGKFIKLGADIEYDGTENNYTPIGTRSNKFMGTFDGDGHTISGIRINNSSDNQGLFGYFFTSNGIVKNITLSDCDITGHNYVGGIVGFNDGGTVTNCRVNDDVFIRADNKDAISHSGIVGCNDDGTVEGCFSAATVTRRVGKGNCFRYGSIVGDNRGIVRNSIAVGSTITADTKGAIVGNNDKTLANNYYYDCNVDNATTNIGTGKGDITDNDGAVRAVSFTTKPAEIGVQIATYPHIGLTVYEHGAYYNGTYYLRHDLAGTAEPLTLTQGTKDGVSAWWGTFYDGTTNHTLSEGTAAYTLGTDYKLYRLGDDGRTIPAGTAVVIIAASADAAIVPAGTAALSITDHAPGGNILVGNDSATTYSTVYVLSVSAGEVGFRKLSGGTLPAHKAGYTTKGTGIPNYDKRNKQEW